VTDISVPFSMGTKESASRVFNFSWQIS